MARFEKKIGARWRRCLVVSTTLAAGCILVALSGAAAMDPQGGTDSMQTTESAMPAGRAAVAPRAEGARGSLYKQALPPYRFQFPRDHAAHPEYQTEWWYYTGHLENGQRKYGYELTFFQVGIDPRWKESRSAWAPHTIYFAHLALTDENEGTFQFAESLSRPALGMAGARTDRYEVWIHDWSAKLLPDGRTHRVQANAGDFAIQLDLTPQKPPVVHGFRGVSQKAAGEGRASHYYSLTRLATEGTLTLRGEQIPVRGLSWMDREFGSNQLTDEQIGWDWFSLQLDDGRELMLYVLRLQDGGIDPHSSGTFVREDGTWKHLPVSAYRIEPTRYWTSSASGATYPSGWNIRVPDEGFELQVTPTLQDQEMRTEGSSGVVYWEGSVNVTGSNNGKPVRGRGYVELTGYSGAISGI